MSASGIYFAILLKTAIIFLFVASLACLTFGLILLWRAQWVFSFSDTMNRWVSTRKVMRPLDVPRDIQRHIYRRHRLVGVFLILGAMFVMYFLFVRYNPAPLLAVVGHGMPVRAATWLLHSAWWVLLVTNSVALVLGVVMLLRPSLLKYIESWADQAYSPRLMGKTLETPHNPLDRLLRRHPLAMGIAITVGSFYVLIYVTGLLFR